MANARSYNQLKNYSYLANNNNYLRSPYKRRGY